MMCVVAGLSCPSQSAISVISTPDCRRCIAVVCRLCRTPYGPKTRSAESQGQPRVTTKGYISVRNFGICESASVQETPRIKQETPKSWTRRIPPACQPFMTDTSVAAVMTARLDRAGEVGHCWFIQTAREISRKRNGSRHFDIGSSHYRRRQGLSPAVSDRSSFRAIRPSQKWS